MLKALGVEIEIDWGYFGGKCKGNRGRGSEGKILVFLRGLEKSTQRSSPMPLVQLWRRLSSAKWSLAASSILTVERGTIRLMLPNSNTIGSTIQCFFQRAKTTLMGSRVSGNRPNAKCADLTGSQGHTLGYIWRSVNGIFIHLTQNRNNYIWNNIFNNMWDSYSGWILLVFWC